jgi:hypothetical protein
MPTFALVSSAKSNRLNTHTTNTDKAVEQEIHTFANDMDAQDTREWARANPHRNTQHGDRDSRVMGSGYRLCLPDIVLGAFAHDVPTEGGRLLGRHTTTQKRIDMVSAPMSSGYRSCARSREGRGCAAQRCGMIEPFSTPGSYPQIKPLDVRVSFGDDGDDGDR